jgi:two-component system sensor kinase FixL
MLEFFRQIFSADFMPHGHCYFWRPEIIWLHVGSDALIALAYSIISFALIRLVRLRRDIVFQWMFVLFGIVILACGATHVMSIVTLWHPVYRLEGIVKAATALASVPTAFLLLGLVPRVVRIPSPQQLKAAIQALADEQEQVQKLNAELELRVKERTAQLEEANARLASLTETLDLAQLMIRKVDGTILFWSKGSEELYGWTKEEAMGRSCHDLLCSQSDVPLADLDMALLRRSHWEGEITHRKRDGRLITVASHWALRRDENGEPQTVTEVNNDITEQKRAERELLRMNEDLRHFGYAASHDLQEPLRMVVSYTQLLARNYRDKLDADAIEFIGYSVEGAMRMQTLFAGLREYWHASERGEEHRKWLDCNAALRGALCNLNVAIKETDARVFSGDLPTVYAEEIALVQIFQNLIGNAIKYSADLPPEIHVSAESTEGAWQFSVRDNGIGIEPRHNTLIFGVFKRLNGSKYPGAGIGLAICRKFVERHGGKIWVESEEGAGATFKFTLSEPQA